MNKNQPKNKQALSWRRRLIIFTSVYTFIWVCVIGIFAFLRLNEARIDFTSQMDEEIMEMTSRLDTYNDLIYATRAILLHDKDLTIPQWHLYLDSMALEDRYPDVLAMGYSAAVKTKDLDKYEQYLNNLYSSSKKTFDITPTSEGDNNYILTYAHDPILGSNPPLGSNYAIDPTRREIIEKAFASGTSQMTPPLTIIGYDNTQQIVLLYFPMYIQGKPIDTPTQRLAAAKGVVMLVFTAPSLMQNALFMQENETEQIAFSIVDTTDQSNEILVHESQSMSTPNISYKAVIDFSGRKWKFTFHLPIMKLVMQQRTFLSLALIIAMVLFTITIGHLMVLNFIKKKEK